MTLLLDLGNSYLKWATLENDAVTPQIHLRGRVGWHANSSPEPLWDGLSSPEIIAIASVAGTERRDLLRRRLAARWPHAQIIEAKSTAALAGLRNAYKEPERLGVDRWLAMLGALKRGTQPFCVASSGTALTLDAVDGEGNHLGGLIIPGIAMMREALIAGTKEIRVEGSGEGDHMLGVTSREGVFGGSRFAAVAAVERFVEQLVPRFGMRPRLFLTGGDAELIQSALRSPGELAPQLLFEGMVVWLQALSRCEIPR